MGKGRQIVGRDHGCQEATQGTAVKEFKGVRVEKVSETEESEKDRSSTGTDPAPRSLPRPRPSTALEVTMKKLLSIARSLSLPCRLPVPRRSLPAPQADGELRPVIPQPVRRRREQTLIALPEGLLARAVEVGRPLRAEKTTMEIRAGTECRIAT